MGGCPLFIFQYFQQGNWCKCNWESNCKLPLVWSMLKEGSTKNLPRTPSYLCLRLKTHWYQKAGMFCNHKFQTHIEDTEITDSELEINTLTFHSKKKTQKNPHGCHGYGKNVIHPNKYVLIQMEPISVWVSVHMASWPMVPKLWAMTFQGATETSHMTCGILTKKLPCTMYRISAFMG